MSVSPIPPGYHSITPYLIVGDARAAIDFYERAFNAEKTLQKDGPGGKIMHAEIKIGDSIVMLADEFPEMGAVGPATLGGVAGSLMIYTEDVDAMFAQALAAGAVEKRPVQDQFYGDRSGILVDPQGHEWNIATHKEDLTPEEIDQRFEAMMKQHGA